MVNTMIMRKLFILPLLFIAYTVGAQEIANGKPKLVVGIVVDQMRYDFIARYWDKYEDGGFKRLIANGTNCKDAHYNYVPTYTAPGHASIYTGTTPAVHGIISNQWYDKYSEQSIYCVTDTTVQPVGTTSPYGSMSPKNMLVSTITDELRLASNMRSKVVSLSIKDRSAILPAGNTANGAYWFLGGNEGKFVTSSHYIDKMPEWVDQFNHSKVAEKYAKTNWTTLLPIEQYTESLPDDNPYEGTFEGEEKPVFPHRFKQLREANGNYSLFTVSPWGNNIVTDFALAALEGEQLGKDNHTDFLAISYSSTDKVGHMYGPHSIETQDTYLRLNLDIKRLLEYLDKEVGQGNYLLFLTADHGAVSVPAYLESLNIPAGYFNQQEMVDTLKGYLNTVYGEGDWVKDVSNLQVFLNHELLTKKGVRLHRMQETIASFLVRLDGVARTLSATSLNSTEFSSGPEQLVQRGFNQKRSGDVAVILQPGYISYPRYGTTHGSAYSYDTHIPLLWYGYGVQQKTIFDRVNITDIAPTIAAFLNIPAPNGTTGQPIVELFK